MLVSIRMGTNMAAGNQQKHLSLIKITVVVVRHSNKILKIVVTDLKILRIDVSVKIL